MKFRMALAFITLAAASLGAGCASSPSTSQTGDSTTIAALVIGTTFPEPSLDETKNGYASTITGLSLETLLKLGPQGQLAPYLATSMAHPSPLTYVFQLHRGIKFWDGSELTAADVVYALDYERTPSSQASDNFSTVKSVVATGRYTVVVTLTQPDPSFPYGLTNSGYIFEKKFAMAHKGTFGDPGVLVMGTGPWEIDSFDPTTGAELSANPHWWGGRVPIQHISFKFFANDTSAALAFRAGEIDLDPFIDGPESFAAASGAKILAAPVTLAAWGADVSGPPSKRPTSYFTSGCATPDVSGYDWLLGSQNLQEGLYNTADWAPPQVDTLLNAGLAAPTATSRFAAYSQLLRIVAADVPYVPLFLHDYCIALSSKFTFPGYNQYSMTGAGPYALGIKLST